MEFQVHLSHFLSGNRWEVLDLNLIIKQSKLMMEYSIMQATMTVFFILFFPLDANKSEDDQYYLKTFLEKLPSSKSISVSFNLRFEILVLIVVTAVLSSLLPSHPLCFISSMSARTTSALFASYFQHLV